jgi:hypothetical protein
MSPTVVAPIPETRVPTDQQQAAPGGSTINRHLGGFIRPDLGIGYLSASASQDGASATISGLAGAFGIAFGGAVAEDQIIAFHIWDAVATNPSFTYNGATTTNTNSSLAFVAVGAEYTAYSQGNYYFSITPSLSRVTLTLNGTSEDMSWGFGIRLGLGKEWWVSDHWGLGLVGHLSLTANQDSGVNPPTWIGWSGTLAFSATYN